MHSRWGKLPAGTLSDGTDCNNDGAGCTLATLAASTVYCDTNYGNCGADGSDARETPRSCHRIVFGKA